MKKMCNLRRIWPLLLLLFLSACATGRQEPTPAGLSSTTTEASETPTEIPFPTKPPATETVPPTMPPTATSVPQIRPLYHAVNIRSGPGETFPEIGFLFQDEAATVVGTDEYDDWYEILTEDGREGWVAASVVEVVEGRIVMAETVTVSPEMTGDSDVPRVRVTVNSANIRSGPGENYPVIDSLSQGSTVTVLGHAYDGAWFNVQLAQGSRGWIGAVVTEPVGGWGLEEISVVETVPAPPAPSTPPNSAAPTSAPQPTQLIQPTQTANCDSAYPTVCIPPPPPDLDCRHVPYRNFTVLPPDPHGFDGDNDGVGCET